MIKQARRDTNSIPISLGSQEMREENVKIANVLGFVILTLENQSNETKQVGDENRRANFVSFIYVCVVKNLKERVRPLKSE
mmetsp:Transcript_19587/g.22274  ORF Transcript_19587/g.22274 Transcript_19587/m.22274 type:complete len:81 (+) Transcript_19587:140-382(+)